MKTIKQLLLIAPLLVWACSGNQEEKELTSKIQNIHDATMVKMSTIDQLKTRLKEDIAEADTAQAERVQVAENLIDELNESENKMMEWMRNYSEELKNTPEDQKIEFLREELDKVEELQFDINENIEDAEAFLKVRS